MEFIYRKPVDIDIFICTDGQSAGVIENHQECLFRDIWFIDDDEYQRLIQEYLLRIGEGKGDSRARNKFEGRKLLQWQKLHYAKMKTDSFNGYDVVYKYRTDLLPNRWENIQIPHRSDEIIMNSDYAFGASREAFNRIADFLWSH